MSDKVSAVLDGLNEEQKKAVSCTEGPVLIVAGAGSGKTRVLTSRIAYILSQGTEPSRVLALTFTKKAAGEMKERIAGLVGSKPARHLVMGTFHAVFVRFLREYASFLGYPENFTIYDTSDSQSAVKACVKELGLDDKIYKPKDVLSRISSAKNNLITVSAYRANHDMMMADARSKKPRMSDLYDLYQKKLKQSGVMDFDDILLNMNILLKDNREALLSIADRFSYIMVDEYQDTNRSQYIILRKLAQFHQNICVVGDDSQSIYAFRGARIENILNFKRDYPTCKVFRLELNYRSTKTIVDAANSLIDHNKSRIPKVCYSQGEHGEKIRLLRSWSETGEAESIVSDIIGRMRADHAQYQDFAILYRTNSQSRAIEEQLRRRNIPYMIYSGNSFFDRAEIKDMMAYFKLCVNPYDDESFKRVVNKPARGIGATTLQSLEQLARERGTSLFKVGLNVPKVKPFCDMIEKLAVLVKSTDAFDLARRIADDSGLYAFLKSDSSIEGQSRVSNLDELINSVAVFVEERQQEAEESGEDYSGAIFTLDDFLENVSLLSNVDVSEDEDTNNKVSMMTVHSSKGLEYPYVYIAGLEENLFPSLSMLSSEQDVEEERRLCYVAVTRARKAVTLSFSNSRMRNGKHESNSPSRFIKEIDPSYIENPLSREELNSMDDAGWGGFSGRTALPGGFRSTYGTSGPARTVSSASRPSFPVPKSSSSSPVRPSAPAGSQRRADLNFEGVPMTELKVGERVEHNRFGAGVILSLSGSAPDMKARICFDEYGEKLLLLSFAKLRPLE